MGSSEKTYNLIYLDEDYFIVKVEAFWDCIITLTIEPTSHNLDMQLYSQYGVHIGECTNPNSNEDYTIDDEYAADMNYTIIITCAS